MIRQARVLLQQPHSLTLQLVRFEKCAGCPKHCNEPLFDLFGLKKNTFTLAANDQRYQLIDNQHKLSQTGLEGQLLSLSIDHNDLLKSSMLLYLLPLLICLLCLLAGHYLGTVADWNRDLSALLGLLLGLGMVYVLSQAEIFSKNLKFRPKVTIL